MTATYAGARGTEDNALGVLPEPVPAAGVDAYLRERALAMEADPRKRLNFDLFESSARRAATVDYLPIKLDIENVSRCNFRCRMCVVSEWTNGRRADDISLNAFRDLIDEQYGLLEIKLQGIGEPLLQRDDFFEMIRYARAKHIWVRTTTNASLLHLKGNAAALIDSGVNEVQISIDGATKPVYEGIRVGSVFERVMANCRLINAYCRAHRKPRTKMWTVVQKANLDQLEALVDLAAALGFDNQVFSLDLSDWGVARWSERNREASGRGALTRDRLMALVERGAGLGVSVRFWQVAEKYRLDDPERLCPWPFERAYVGSDLRIVPCCYIGNPDVLQIDGPIGAGRNLADIWYGDEFKEFRRAHLEARLPDICRACYDSDPPRPGGPTVTSKQ